MRLFLLPAVIFTLIVNVQTLFNEQPAGSYENYDIIDPIYGGKDWGKLEKPGTGLNRGSGGDSRSGSDRKIGRGSGSRNDDSSESGSRSGSDSGSGSDKEIGKKFGSGSDGSSESGSRSGGGSSSGGNRKYGGRYWSGSGGSGESGKSSNRRNNRKYRGSWSGRSSEGSWSGSSEESRSSESGSSGRDRGNRIYDYKAGGPFFYREGKSSHYPGLRVVAKYGARKDNGGMFDPMYDWLANWGGYGNYGGDLSGVYDYGQYTLGREAQQMDWMNMINNFRFK